MKTKEELGKALWNYIYENHNWDNSDNVDLNVVQKYLDDGADINFHFSSYIKVGYIEALGYYIDNYVMDYKVLDFLLEKGINYEYYLNKESDDKDGISYKYLKQYHEAKLLKEKLEKDLNCDTISKVRLNKI